MSISQTKLESLTRAAARECVSCYSKDYIKEHKIMDRELRARGLQPQKVAALATRFLIEEEQKFNAQYIPTKPRTQMGREWVY